MADRTDEANVTERVVLFSWIAGQLHGVGSGLLADWIATNIGVQLSGRRFQQVVAPVRRQSPYKGQRGPRGERRLVRKQPLLDDWLLVDEQGVGLLRVLYRLANDGMPQPELLAALDELPGIRQVLETTHNRDVLAVGLVRNLEEARDLRARIEEIAPGRPVAMDFIETESHRPAARTWLALARRELADE